MSLYKCMGYKMFDLHNCEMKKIIKMYKLSVLNTYQGCNVQPNEASQFYYIVYRKLNRVNPESLL